jgi:protoporphyrinogen/coproporphyrinogen III oxidase
MTISRSPRIAVAGAGLSGLAAAHRLIELQSRAGSPCEVTVFEAGDRLGGIVGTRDIAGYRIETGADSFITNKPWALDLCRRLGLESRLIPTDARFRRSLVLRNGRPVEVPEGFQLLAPVKVSALWRSPIFSTLGKLRMALEYVLPRGATNGDESLAHFVRRRFGAEALERLVQPMVVGIYTSDPEKLSLRATMPRFLEMEQQYGSVIRGLKHQARRSADSDPTASGARYGLFATPEAGISELVDRLADKVQSAASVRLNSRIIAVRQERDDGFQIQSAGGAAETFDAIVLALPTYCVAELIGGFAPKAAELLNRIEYASTAIVVSGHKLDDVRHPLDAFGLVVPMIERRRILAVSFTSRKFPGRAPEGCVQMRTFVGGAMQPELVNCSDDEILELVRGELESILGVTWRPDFAVVARWMRSMPQYLVGHLDLVAEIEREMQPFPRLALAGHAYRGVGIPDSIHSGEQAAERIFESVTR